MLRIMWDFIFQELADLPSVRKLPSPFSESLHIEKQQQNNPGKYALNFNQLSHVTSPSSLFRRVQRTFGQLQLDGFSSAVREQKKGQRRREERMRKKREVMEKVKGKQKKEGATHLNGMILLLIEVS